MFSKPEIMNICGYNLEVKFIKLTFEVMGNIFKEN